MKTTSKIEKFIKIEKNTGFGGTLVLELRALKLDIKSGVLMTCGIIQKDATLQE